MKTLQHLGNFLILIPPTKPQGLVNVSEIKTVPKPHPHLVRRANRHHQKALELGPRKPLLAKLRIPTQSGH